MPDLQLRMLFQTFLKTLSLLLLDASLNISTAHFTSTLSAFEVILQLTHCMNYLTYLLTRLSGALFLQQWKNFSQESRNETK